MNVINVIVDEKPKDCMVCPLLRGLTRECGKEYVTNYNGSVAKGKKPDKHCRLSVNTK